MKEAFPDDREKLDQVEKCVAALPLVNVEVTAGTNKDGGGLEDVVCLNDLLDVKIKVKFDHLAKGQESGYVHSRDYPFLKRDDWFLFVTDRTMTGVAMAERIDFEDDKYEKQFYEKVQRTGSISFSVMLVNDSYKGLDVVEKVDINVSSTERENQPGYKEYQYSKEDLAAIKETSILSIAPAPVVEDDIQSDDEDKPEEPESDQAELLRRLRRDGLTDAVEEFEREMAELKENLKKLKFKPEKSPFVPKVTKTLQERRELQKAEKEAAKNQAEIEEANKEIMDKGREPLDIETYKMLVGYKGVDEQMICYVPTTNWCKHDTYFDGIKYTGPLGQNPLNRLMIEKHEKDTLAALEARLKQEEAEK